MFEPIEKGIEKGLFASRWLMAPFYIGLVGALAALLVTFCKELWHFVSNAATMGANDAILGSLALIDISLAGNLLIIVTFSGYENFVSRINVGEHEDQPSWKSDVDFSALKLKLIASMVAISGIHLLKVFMEIKKYSDQEIMWMVIIHLVFVGSGVFLALMDKIAVSAKVMKKGPFL